MVFHPHYFSFLLLVKRRSITLHCCDLWIWSTSTLKMVSYPYRLRTNTNTSWILVRYIPKTYFFFLGWVLVWGTYPGMVCPKKCGFHLKWVKSHYSSKWDLEFFFFNPRVLSVYRYYYNTRLDFSSIFSCVRCYVWVAWMFYFLFVDYIFIITLKHDFCSQFFVEIFAMFNHITL